MRFITVSLVWMRRYEPDARHAGPWQYAGGTGREFELGECLRLGPGELKSGDFVVSQFSPTPSKH